MKYKEAMKIADLSTDCEPSYLFRLLETYDSILWWAKHSGVSKKEADRLLKSAIDFLEFVGIESLISDWDEVKGKK